MSIWYLPFGDNDYRTYQKSGECFELMTKQKKKQTMFLPTKEWKMNEYEERHADIERNEKFYSELKIENIDEGMTHNGD